MQKLLKVKFDEGNQTLDVPNDCEIVDNLFASLDGAILLIRMPDTPVVATTATEVAPEVTDGV